MLTSDFMTWTFRDRTHFPTSDFMTWTFRDRTHFPTIPRWTKFVLRTNRWTLQILRAATLRSTHISVLWTKDPLNWVGAGRLIGNLHFLNEVIDNGDWSATKIPWDSKNAMGLTVLGFWVQISLIVSFQFEIACFISQEIYSHNSPDRRQQLIWNVCEEFYSKIAIIAISAFVFKVISRNNEECPTNFYLRSVLSKKIFLR